MTDDEFAAKAAELGLVDLARDYPEDLRKALENGKALRSRLPLNLHWTEEPAHTFCLVPRRRRTDEGRA